MNAAQWKSDACPGSGLGSGPATSGPPVRANVFLETGGGKRGSPTSAEHSVGVTQTRYLALACGGSWRSSLFWCCRFEQSQSLVLSHSHLHGSIFCHCFVMECRDAAPAGLEGCLRNANAETQRRAGLTPEQRSGALQQGLEKCMAQDPELGFCNPASEGPGQFGTARMLRTSRCDRAALAGCFVDLKGGGACVSRGCAEYTDRAARERQAVAQDAAFGITPDDRARFDRMGSYGDKLICKRLGLESCLGASSMAIVPVVSTCAQKHCTVPSDEDSPCPDEARGGRECRAGRDYFRSVLAMNPGSRNDRLSGDAYTEDGWLDAPDFLKCFVPDDPTLVSSEDMLERASSCLQKARSSP